MATSKAEDHTAAGGSDKELPAQEEKDKSSERRLVDVLLDISEEDFLKELEPYEYHCYSGLEEAVRGWARVAPLSCILVTQKRYKKPKHKEADNLAPLSVDPTVPNADSSASIAEHRCESHTGPNYNLKKSMPLKQQVGSWSNPAVAALQPDASEWPVLNAMQKTMSHLFLEEKIEEGGTPRETPLQCHHLSSKYSASENRPAKPQKHSHRPNNTVVPIKNFTFLPPIKSPRLNPKVSGQLCSGKRASEGETLEENCFMFDKKSETKGTRVDPVGNTELPNYSAALTSKYQACQHNPHLFSAVSVSIPKRYQVPVSSKPVTLHHRSYSEGKSLTQALHASTAAGAQAHMQPSCLFS
ncbi:uncharacterized protein si:ch73-103b9.2 [Toxotes jaculatrix]|uniref:uncharacterized protein si:ch73-103b9.2 n=1 Tax=Toxotes jaculatrix TaxID=941984 RepID=UPI001B3AC830|nr:uncharacterized protein si:ch73-103b9.2 [Toxotes jaculatrix]